MSFLSGLLLGTYAVLLILTGVIKGENPAQTISFLWDPLVYPVRWADAPEDVPEWDASRQPQAWDYDFVPPSLRGNFINDAPPTRYPRLVCADEKRRRVRPWPESGPEDLLNELLAVYEYIRPWRSGKPVKKLRDKVLALANKYGAPYRRENNTLGAWLCLAAVVHGYVLGYQLLQKLEYEGMQAKIDDMLEPFPEATHSDSFGAEPRFSNEGASPVEMERLVLSQLRRLGRTFEARDVEIDWHLQNVTWIIHRNTIPSFRLGVAEHLHGMFNHAFNSPESTQSRLEVTSQMIYAKCNVSTWAYYRLAQMWRHGAEVQSCPVCGTLFAPTRRNMKYCRRGTCAFKAHKQNQKARAPHS